MHKPSSVRSLSTPYRPYQLLSLPPYSSTRILQPPERPPRSRSPLSRSSFDSCSFQLPTYTQSTLFIAKTSFCNSSFLFLFFFYPFHFPSVFLSFLFLSFFIRRSRTLHFLVNVPFFSRFSGIRDNPYALGFFSITPFPIEHGMLFLLKSSCSTSGYLTPLINSRYKSLGFGLSSMTRDFF